MDSTLDSGIAFYHEKRAIPRKIVDLTIKNTMRKNVTVADEIFLTPELTVDMIDLESAANQIGNIVVAIASVVAQRLDAYAKESTSSITNNHAAMDVIRKMVRVKLSS